MIVEEMEALLRKSVGVAVSSIEVRRSIVQMVESMFETIKNPDFGTDALKVCFILECFEHMQKSGVFDTLQSEDKLLEMFGNQPSVSEFIDTMKGE
jgi:hypothetical protein